MIVSKIKLIILIALKKEIPECLEKHSIPIITLNALKANDYRQLNTSSSVLCIITGVGKANSIDTINWIHEHCQADTILNIGSCGTNNQDYLHQIITPHYHTYKDLSLIYSLGTFPFLNNLLITHVNNCESVTDISAPNLNADIIDMESYWQASLSEKYHIPYCSIKYATDLNNHNLKQDFNASLSKLRSTFSVLLQEAIFRNHNPDISVIIPTYNRAPHLKKCIDSVLNQSTSVECIVVDDGSTDSSPTIISAYKNKIKHVQLTQNKGVSFARNTGIQHASGNWVMFIDSDDEWKKNKVQRQIEYLHHHPYISVLQSEEKWIRNGAHLNKKKYHQKKSGFIFDICLERCMISPSSVLIEKSVFNHYGYFDEHLPTCEDYDLWLRLSRRLLIGLEPTQSLIKYGGHSDQLSLRYDIMDQFRIYSLKKALQKETHPFFRDKIIRTLTKKEEIVANGIKKRKEISSS